MCWITTNPLHMREYRAPEDTTVYKVLRVEKGLFKRKKFVSPCIGFHYKPEKMYHVKLKITTTGHSMVIEEGLHCFKNMSSAGIYADSLIGPCAIVPAIIPKGTRYYINEDSQIVTEKLKIIL